MPRGTRQRIATGIFRDSIGIAVIVSVNGKPHEYRCAHDADVAELIKERLTLKKAGALNVERESATADTLRADAATYLSTLTGRHKADADDILTHWVTAFGDRHRDAITAVDVRQQLAAWGKAPSTLNHRRQVLSSLYKSLNGANGYNPVREVPKVRERYDTPRSLSYSVITAILDQMGPTQSRARFAVMAYTGLPQAQMAQLTPADVDLKAKTVRVSPRRKGKGSPGRTLPLSPQAVQAFKDFAAADCWGEFSRSSMAKAFRNAVRNARATRQDIPASIRAYDLRHSFLTEVYRKTGDIHAVSHLALHSTPAQTARYAQSAVKERMAEAIRATFSKRGTGQKQSKMLDFKHRNHDQGALKKTRKKTQ